MMSLQEQEHWDHEMGAASEQQNALQWSRMTTELRCSKIDKALAEDKIVIVRGYPAYCQSTDAYIGEQQSLYATYGTRTEAEAELELLCNDEDAPDEMRFFIEPYLVIEQQPIENGDDHAPF